MRKNSEKGFTLMEMLIVVGIIAVLVAVAIPTFTASVTKVREATDHANLRAAFAMASAKYLDGSEQGIAKTPEMQADGELTIDDVPFSWDREEIVTVIVDKEGIRQG